MRAQKKIVNHTPETSKNRVVQMHNQRIESHDLDPDLLYISRQIAFTNPTTLRQALPGHWALFRFHDIKPNSLSFTSQLGHTQLQGNVYVFLPANTLIEWHFRPEIFSYESFTSFAPMDTPTPQYPVVIPFHKPHKLEHHRDIIDFLIHSGLREMSPSATTPYVPHKVKKFFDVHFTEDIPLAAITKDLRMSHMTMTSKFKAQFGVTPVQYRNALRTFEAKRLLRNKHSVTEAGLMAGFTSMTQYNHHFHMTFNHAPSIATKL
tara:strand:- start:118806 stop:119594 length:789 start_codon:yes stop_codon:yes gene_type:complete